MGLYNKAYYVAAFLITFFSNMPLQLQVAAAVYTLNAAMCWSLYIIPVLLALLLYIKTVHPIKQFLECFLFFKGNMTNNCEAFFFFFFWRGGGGGRGA